MQNASDVRNWHFVVQKLWLLGQAAKFLRKAPAHPSKDLVFGQNAALNNW